VAEPCIKGSVFKGVIDDLARLQEEGRVSQEDVDAQLVAEDLAFLEGEISRSMWYPMESYGRLMQLLGEIEGAGKDAYFLERGRASARRLIESGLYQQLAFLSRWETPSGSDGGDQLVIAGYARNLRMVSSLASAIYNVGKWEVEPDPDHPGRVSIAVREARAYTEPMRLAIEGFLNECSRAARGELNNLFTSERPSPDLILLRMTRDIIGLNQA
jgi:hypothetical protein